MLAADESLQPMKVLKVAIAVCSKRILILEPACFVKKACDVQTKLQISH